ncbi:MAG: sugar transferase [Armatimonadota bacterium]
MVWYKSAKRPLGSVLALIAIIIFTPLCLIMALVIYLDDPGQVIFKQRRIGLHGREFILYKFRSMRLDTPNVSTAEMQRLVAEGANFMTRSGAFLRKSSLDELPQLWNILKGDMSFVGPRPALYSQHDLITLREEAGVHSVRPGLTGWAQVNGRDELDIPVKVEFDKEYVQRCSLWFDIYIIIRTVIAIFTARGNK